MLPRHQRRRLPAPAADRPAACAQATLGRCPSVSLGVRCGTRHGARQVPGAEPGVSALPPPSPPPASPWHPGLPGRWSIWAGAPICYRRARPAAAAAGCACRARPTRLGPVPTRPAPDCAASGSGQRPAGPRRGFAARGSWRRGRLVQRPWPARPGHWQVTPPGTRSQAPTLVKRLHAWCLAPRTWHRARGCQAAGGGPAAEPSPGLGECCAAAPAH